MIPRNTLASWVLGRLESVKAIFQPTTWSSQTTGTYFHEDILWSNEHTWMFFSEGVENQSFSTTWLKLWHISSLLFYDPGLSDLSTELNGTLLLDSMDIYTPKIWGKDTKNDAPAGKCTSGFKHGFILGIYDRLSMLTFWSLCDFLFEVHPESFYMIYNLRSNLVKFPTEAHKIQNCCMRILVLHGYSGNASWQQKKDQRLQKLLQSFSDAWLYWWIHQ